MSTTLQIIIPDITTPQATTPQPSPAEKRVQDNILTLFGRMGEQRFSTSPQEARQQRALLNIQLDTLRVSTEGVPKIQIDIVEAIKTTNPGKCNPEMNHAISQIPDSPTQKKHHCPSEGHSPTTVFYTPTKGGVT